VGDAYYPVADKDELLSQIPSLKKSLLYYKDYSKKSMSELFPESTLKDSKVFEVKILSSIILMSKENGYDKIDLPLEGQFSPIYSFLVIDFDKDGILDLIAGGNQFQIKPQFGGNDASNGWLFKGQLKNGQFSFGRGIDLHVSGQIRGIELLEINKLRYIFFAKYDDELEVYEIPN
jgi:hypothetical protein